MLLSPLSLCPRSVPPGDPLPPRLCLQQEHRFEKALREKKGFIIKRMKEDGACLFRAVGEPPVSPHVPKPARWPPHPPGLR